MSTLKNARIKSYIEQNFSSLIDVSQISGHENNKALLTRGLSALAVILFTGCSKEDAAMSVVDAGGDGGIDAIYHDNYTNTIYFVQSKFSEDGNKTIDEGSAHKMIHGIDKLLVPDFEGFNEKVKEKEEIISKIVKDASVKIVICIAFNSVNQLSTSVNEIFDKYIERINDGEDIISLQVANLNKLYTVTSRNSGPINEDIAIKNWIHISYNDEGHHEKAYLGLIAASDLASLFEKYLDSLFIPNIRSFKGDTEVNNQIINSINNSPETFCYLNNGITLIANEIKKKPIGGSSRELGIFECKGLAIVNGAQTVGACHKVFIQNENNTKKAYVVAKFIETGKQDSELARAITKAANTQNKIERKDFVSLDPYQKELQEELDILGIRYVYKTGENAQGDNCYDLTYVTQALIADTDDLQLITVAKREIGHVWDDVEKAPYKILFNPSKNGYYVKNLLLLYKEVQDKIKDHTQDDKRKKQYAIYGNVFIASQCLKSIDKLNINNATYKINDEISKIGTYSILIFDKIYSIVETNYPGTPLIYLFRNVGKLSAVRSIIENDIQNGTL